MAVLLSACGVSTCALADTNVALNAAVTANGVFGTGGWDGGVLGTTASVTDGVSFAETTRWDSNSVWWNDTMAGAGANSIEINLGGQFALSRFSIQADDNDTYRIEYNNNGTWQTAWDIGLIPSTGLVTRDSGLLSPIVTDKLRVSATGGDHFYAVSEVQAFGVSAVPEPESFAMMLAGLGLLAFAKRRKAAK